MREARFVVSACVIVGVFAFVQPTPAQESNSAPHKAATMHVGPGFPTDYNGETLWEVAAGVALVWQNGLGVSVEAAFVLDTVSNFESFESGVILISPAALYVFSTEGKLRPYLRGGMTFNDISRLMADIGGGIDYWFTDQVALMSDVRHHRFLEDTSEAWTTVSIGMAFRFD